MRTALVVCVLVCGLLAAAPAAAAPFGHQLGWSSPRHNGHPLALEADPASGKLFALEYHQTPYQAFAVLRYPAGGAAAPEADGGSVLVGGFGGEGYPYDFAYHRGRLIVPFARYAAGGMSSTPGALVFDAETLALDQAATEQLGALFQGEPGSADDLLVARIAVDPRDDSVWVAGADPFGAQQPVVAKLSPDLQRTGIRLEQGRLPAVPGGAGRAPIAVDPRDGSVLVLGGGATGSIDRFAADGSYVGQVASGDSLFAWEGATFDLEVGADGTIHVNSRSGGWQGYNATGVLALDPQGQLLMRIGDRVRAGATDETPCRYSTDPSLAVGPGGMLYAANAGSGYEDLTGVEESAPGRGRIDALGPGGNAADCVVQEPPTARLAVEPLNPGPGEPVTLDASASSDPNDAVARYEWDVDGDAQFERVTTEPRIVVTYDRPGTVLVSVRVRDTWDAPSVAEQPLRVRGAVPEARFALAPDPPRATVPVTLDASGSDGDIVRFEWDLDGDEAYERATEAPAIGHTFAAPGDQLVGLRVTTSDGERRRTARTVQVLDAPPPPPAPGPGDDGDGTPPQGPASTAPRLPARLRVGGGGRVSVRVRCECSGTLVLRRGSRTLARAKLREGAASVRLRPRLSRAERRILDRGRTLRARLELRVRGGDDVARTVTLRGGAR